MAPKRSSSPAPAKGSKAAKGSPAPPRPPSAKVRAERPLVQAQEMASKAFSLLPYVFTL